MQRHHAAEHQDSTCRTIVQVFDSIAILLQRTTADSAKFDEPPQGLSGRFAFVVRR